MTHRNWRTASVATALLLTPLLVLGAFAQPGEVRPGMSEEQVVRLLGQPTRKAVLVGKALRDAEEVSAEDLARRRLVYVYDPSGLQVWFWDGKVTGVTRHGVLLQ
jgi:hypothetical protein